MTLAKTAILVTGVAGFIGFHVASALLARGETVVGIDIVNDYYDPSLKDARLKQISDHPAFRFVKMDVAEADAVKDLVLDAGITRIIHLAAQAGVRYSIENPFAYQRSNLQGHLSILEACRAVDGFEHLVYASSSSVYGDRPLAGDGFSEDDRVNEPVSLYAATKRSGELMSTTYSHLYGIPQSGLRFFTVYGPWGRPDMAYFSFSEKIMKGEAIEVYGEGHMHRDFTYIDDIVEGIIGVLDHPPAGGKNEIYNIGAHQPVGLMEMISTLETALGREADKIMRPMQPGDVTTTYADVSKLKAVTGYAPSTPLKDGLERFATWFKGYKGLN